jgi:hypothetical protein
MPGVKIKCLQFVFHPLHSFTLRRERKGKSRDSAPFYAVNPQRKGFHAIHAVYENGLMQKKEKRGRGGSSSLSSPIAACNSLRFSFQASTTNFSRIMSAPALSLIYGVALIVHFIQKFLSEGFLMGSVFGTTCRTCELRAVRNQWTW